MPDNWGVEWGLEGALGTQVRSGLPVALSVRAWRLTGGLSVCLSSTDSLFDEPGFARVEGRAIRTKDVVLPVLRLGGVPG